MHEVVIDFLEQEGYVYNEINPNVIHLGFQGKSCSWQVYLQVRPVQYQLVIYSVSPINAPVAQIERVMEFITRANYGMIMGNFELDYSDGEIRYKTSLDVENDELSVELIRNIFAANVLIMDRYMQGVLSVIYGKLDPKAAIQKLEGNLSATAN